jgi:hypothetical protein
MKAGNIVGAVIALAAVACVVFVVVVVEELTYAADHPYAYGPAKIIAWGAGAGALVSVAVGLLAYGLRSIALTRPNSTEG